MTVEQLYSRPYIQVPYPIPRSDLENSIAAFCKFLDQPEEIKNHIDFKIAPLHRRGEIGYKRRKAEDEIYRDNKEFFHFHPLIFSRYEDFISKNSVVKDFLDLAMPIWQTTYQVVYDLLSQFEEGYPGTLAKIFKSNEPHVVLRFLKYHWTCSGLYLARPHFDCGSFTLAIAESSPGLRIGTGPEDLQQIIHEENKAIFMVSSNFRKIIDTNRLTPGWHDVIQLDETKIGFPFARWAIVAFIEGHNVEALPREETHIFDNAAKIP